MFHEAQHFLKRLLFLSWSRNFLPAMKPEDSIPSSQEADNGPYSESTESSPCP